MRAAVGVGRRIAMRSREKLSSFGAWTENFRSALVELDKQHT